MKDLCPFEGGPAKQNLQSATNVHSRPSQVAGRPQRWPASQEWPKLIIFEDFLSSSYFQVVPPVLAQIFSTKCSLFAMYEAISHIFKRRTLKQFWKPLSLKKSSLSRKFLELNLCLSLYSSLSLALLCIEVHRSREILLVYLGILHQSCISLGWGPLEPIFGLLKGH